MYPFKIFTVVIIISGNTVPISFCAREHFKDISGENVVYDVADSYTSLMEKVMK